MEPKTFFLVMHVLALVCGVGGALMLDIYLVRHLRGATVTDRDLAFAGYVAIFVKVGLFAVWASGIGILAVAPDGPASVIANPKVQAKLVVVVVLTLNALIIETVALPLLERNEGRRLFDGVGEVEKSVLLASGAVSSVSWLVPVVLGLARELNHAVPASHILMGYGAMLILAGATAQLAGRLLYQIGSAEREASGAAPFHAAAHQVIKAHFDASNRPANLMDAYSRERRAAERLGMAPSATLAGGDARQSA